ncbi:MAG TPA: hypothetical protein VH109_02620 [Steroidobacteraceae bacterium]|jgi:hypothetical protein|nr:hypothetical protein [Steroidobacteraceae bacterium]
MKTVPSSSRALPILFAAAGTLMLALLLAHPHESARTFADLIEFEIDHRLINQVVHGGTIAVLVLLLAAHSALGRLVDPGSVCVSVAVTAFAAGCGLLIASLVLDGFTVPALALQSRAARDVAVQHAIQGQISFCGTLIGLLMPLGIVGLSASAMAWVRPLVRLGGSARRVGWIAGAAGVVTGVAVIAAISGASPHLLLAGFFLVALWQFALALVASRLAPVVLPV